MKNSVFYAKKILFRIALWTFTLLLIGVNAEDVVHQPTAGASIAQTENFSVSSENEAVSDLVYDVVEGGGVGENVDKIHSSFDEAATNTEEDVFSKPLYAEASQNSGIPNEVSNGGQAVIFTLVDTATAELQQKAEIPPTLSGNNELDKSDVKENTTVPIAAAIIDNKIESLSKVGNRSEDLLNTQQTDRVIKEVPINENLTVEKTHEDIPSFSEWAQKQLEQAEKNKDTVNSSEQNQNLNGKSGSGTKLRSKNYASPDCGAKIVAANPEAQSANSVLSPSRDEYKLNACTNRIWFIVELCEAVQAKKIDLANFELFSSSPKDFVVSVSDRFPSREWANVGQFTAKDERDIQSFDLNPHLFGKYIKVEIKSHHGSEHYCPISLFRVYGTSEFEVLEKEDPVNAANIDDDDDDETLDSEKGEAHKNLFSSATDAVISIVKKAAEVLGNKANVSNHTGAQNLNRNTFKPTPLITSCSTPSHLVVCDNCSDILFGQVYELLSCCSRQLYNLIKVPIIGNALYNSGICEEYGLDFKTKRTTCPVSTNQLSYIKAHFTSKYLAALCNTLAILENKVVLNVSNQCSSNATVEAQDVNNIVEIETSKLEVVEDITQEQTSQLQPTDELTVEQLDKPTIKPNIQTDISYTSQIKPTKAYTPEQHLSRNTDVTEESNLVQPTESFNIQNERQTESTTVNREKPIEKVSEVTENSTENIPDFDATPESTESFEEHLEHLIPDFKEDAIGSAPSVATTTSTPQTQKESVFLRLSNRIKALERNMSLSSQYLEELSRRYKKQVEEMQKLLEKTLSTLSEDSKRKDEKNRQLEEQINTLTIVVEKLVAEKNSFASVWYWVFFLTAVILVMWNFCRRSTEFEYSQSDSDKKFSKVQRRKSIDVVVHKPPIKKKRRPSEEALKIAGTYEHLLVVDEVIPNKYKNRERKRRKRRQLSRSNSFNTLTEEADVSGQSTSDLGHRNKPQSSQNSNIQEPDWVEGNLMHNGIQEIPIVLDESEHSTLEPLQYEDIKKADGIKLPSFIKTATDSRLNRSSSHNGPEQLNGKKKKNDKHRKSASVDETSRKKSPSPSVDEKKKEKKGLRRIFKKVF